MREADKGCDLRLDIRRVAAAEIRMSKRQAKRTTGLEPATFGLGS
jgi:hypothetical protein